MSASPIQSEPVPLWLKIVIIACCAPVAGFFKLMSLCPPAAESRTLLWLYPFYVFAAGICAWMCAGSRRAVTWILLVLLLLTHVAMWLLVDPMLISWLR